MTRVEELQQQLIAVKAELAVTREIVRVLRDEVEQDPDYCNWCGRESCIC